MKKKRAQILPTLETLLSETSFDSYIPMEIIDDYSNPLPRRKSMRKRDLKIWIENIEAYLGESHHSLSVACGRNHSLIQKFMTTDQVSLQTKTLLAIDNYARQKISEKLKDQAKVDHPDDLVICSVDVLNIVTSGTVKSDEPISIAYNARLPIARRWTLSTIIGIKIDSDDMNIIYPPNTVVFGVPVSLVGRQLKTGDKVIAFRKERDVHFCYVREFKLEEDGTAWLWPKSTLPDQQAPNPITLGETKTDALQRGLKVAFLIIASIRPEPNL